MKLLFRLLKILFINCKIMVIITGFNRMIFDLLTRFAALKKCII